MNKIISLLIVLGGLFNVITVYYYFSEKVYSYNSQAYLLKAEEDDGGGIPDTVGCLANSPNTYSK